jgi:uncharacterized repeat protein (TIGR03803 family)
MSLLTLKGTATLLFCALTAMNMSAQSFKSIAGFDGTNGEYPDFGSLVQGLDGNFYGVTFSGGPPPGGNGTVFRVDPEGDITTLYSFAVGYPQATLDLGKDGTLYGTTLEGGEFGDGSVFQITYSGQLTTLHSFNGSDGASPLGGLVLGTDGNLYGTTSEGGVDNFGTVFKINPSGDFATIHSFEHSDGSAPFGGLVQASDGNFYGTTSNGGEYFYDGTIFKITPAGKLTTLYSFNENAGTGSTPQGSLIQARDGNFYGTTYFGGANNGGTVYRLDRSGSFTTLYNFCSESNCEDGSTPFQGVIQGFDGNLYGTTSAGGSIGGGCPNFDGCGTVFGLTTTGKLHTLHSFCTDVCSDGDYPRSTVAQATNGILYGTTYYGGAEGLGNIFRLSIGDRPFVEMLPDFGAVGAVVRILGNNLKGSSGVTFGNFAAQFRVLSNSQIVAKVPGGAGTGNVEVNTPHGVLTSNVPFHVIP